MSKSSSTTPPRKAVSPQAPSTGRTHQRELVNSRSVSVRNMVPNRWARRPQILFSTSRSQTPRLPSPSRIFILSIFLSTSYAHANGSSRDPQLTGRVHNSNGLTCLHGGLEPPERPHRKPSRQFMKFMSSPAAGTSGRQWAQRSLPGRLIGSAFRVVAELQGWSYDDLHLWPIPCARW
jgi:hypothetical protein